jgi:Flp pilus assembly pilin Flp
MIIYRANLSDKSWLGGEESGQTIVEYALIIAVFSVVMVGSLGVFEGGLSAYIQNIVDTLAAIF